MTVLEYENDMLFACPKIIFICRITATVLLMPFACEVGDTYPKDCSSKIYTSITKTVSQAMSKS